MFVLKETKCLKCFTNGKTDQSHVNKIKCCPEEFLKEFLKTIYIKMSISDFQKLTHSNKICSKELTPQRVTDNQTF